MPGYDTKQERVAIGGAASLRICSLLDRQQFFDPLGRAEAVGISSAAWPLFGLVWPSSLHLAAAPAYRGRLLRHRRGGAADGTAGDARALGRSAALAGPG